MRKALNRAAGLVPTTLAAPRLRIPLSDRNRYGTLFGENLEKLAGKCIFVKEPANVVPVLAELLQVKDRCRIECPLSGRLRGSRTFRRFVGFMDREELREVCATADIGITSADYALADTGTLVMFRVRRRLG